MILDGGCGRSFWQVTDAEYETLLKVSLLPSLSLTERNADSMLLTSVDRPSEHLLYALVRFRETLAAGAVFLSVS